MELVNAYAVRNGVRCPHCKDEVYSVEVYKPTKCKCGAISLHGGVEFLAYKVDAPYRLSDVVVVSKWTEEEDEEEEEEVGEVVVDKTELEEATDWVEVVSEFDKDDKDVLEETNEQEAPQDPNGTLD